MTTVTRSVGTIGAELLSLVGQLAGSFQHETGLADELVGAF
jgi:hypothetical protein